MKLAEQKVVSVQNSSTDVLPDNPFRQYGFFKNVSDTAIDLFLGDTAVSGSGIRLDANGGWYEMTVLAGNIWFGKVKAICSVASKNLQVLDGVPD